MDEPTLYSLTQQEFDQLARRLLEQGGMENVNYVGGQMVDLGVDFIAEEL